MSLITLYSDPIILLLYLENKPNNPLAHMTDR